jgi:hypothetical protein
MLIVAAGSFTVKMEDTEAYKVDSRTIKETEDAYIVPITFASEMVQSYGQYGTAYKPAEELIKMVMDMRTRKVPLTLHHPSIEADNWAARATVGYMIPESVYFDNLTNKAKGLAYIYKENQWVVDGIFNGQWDNVSIGFHSKDLDQSGEFDGKGYDFVMTDIITDHVAFCEVGRCPSPICGAFCDSVHADPEVTENYIRIPVAQKGEGEIRTITISPEKGIKALVQKDNGKMKVVTYLFEKTKWTMETAKEWIDAHKPNGSQADNLISEKKMTDEKKPTDEVKEETTPEPTQKEDCSEKIDSLVAEHEKKLEEIQKSSADALESAKEEIRAEFQKKLDEMVKAQEDEAEEEKPEEEPADEAEEPAEEAEEAPEEEEEKKEDALPATGKKSVKPSSDVADDVDFEAMKAKRQSTYIFAKAD